MATALKRLLSGSADGRGILISATSGPGTLLHTATSSSSPGAYDEVWLWVANTDTSSLTLNVQIGGLVAATVQQIPFLDGLVPVMPGLIVQAGAEIRAWAGAANKLVVYGFVNRISD